MCLSTVVTLLGVVCVTQPPFLTGIELDADQLVRDSFLNFRDDEVLKNENSQIGTSLAIGCSVFMAAAIVMIRHLKKIHHSVTLVFFGGYGTLESFLLTIGFGVLEFPTLEIGNIEVYMAVAIGLLSCASQIFLIFALK